MKLRLVAGLGLLFLLVGGLIYFRRSRASQEGPYTRIVEALNAHSRDACDLAVAQERLGLARVYDRYHNRILALWSGRKTEEFPNFKMVQVGPVFLRLSQDAQKRSGYDSSSWSWEEAYGIYLRTQNDPGSEKTKERWRDFDTAFRFLVERDVDRILRGRRFLAPERTEHEFRPSPSVRRINRKYFEVKLDAGDFAGSEKDLTRIFEREWSSPRYRVRVRWVKGDPAAYRLKALFQSGRSFVDHRRKTMLIANFAWTRTVAHELGHVLGFDDHYYSVWNDRNCYYLQESRLSDLMSDSEKGRVTAGHWALLEKAYPLGQPPLKKPFVYIFDRN